MSELGDLETAVIGLITGIQSGGQPMFREVFGFTDPDRKRGVAEIRRRQLPAAMVVYDGRQRANAADSIVGLPRLTVLIATENLRGGDDVRAGDGAAPGGFDLLGSVMSTLDGAIVQTDRRLSAIDEQTVAADETHVVYEQRYLVDRAAELTAPTYDGTAIAGASSLVNVIVGELSAERVSFAFAGIDGEFRHHLGTRGRLIRWRGRLRAVDDAALNNIEATIEAKIAAGTTADMVDSWSRTFADCTVDLFERTGPRRRHPVSGEAIQPFEIRFTQLNA